MPLSKAQELRAKLAYRDFRKAYVKLRNNFYEKVNELIRQIEARKLEEVRKRLRDNLEDNK